MLYFKKMNQKQTVKGANISGLNINERHVFEDLYQRWKKKETQQSQYTPVKITDIVHIDTLKDNEKKLGACEMKRLAVLKVNGGLATSLNIEGPKSAICIDQELTFMHLIARQIKSARQTYQVELPFWLMNSPFTEQKTKEILDQEQISYNAFNQFFFPRIDKHTQDIATQLSQEQLSYPPGHGNLYDCLFEYGILDQLINEDIHFLFVSNSDNLAAEIEPRILGYMLKNKVDFLCEVVQKEAQDNKGGIFVQDQNQIKLLETSQWQGNDLHDDQVTSIFNTNSIWINLHTLKAKMKCLKLPVIANEKTIEGHQIIQLETAMGTAIGFFDHPALLCVNRDRFIPVKNQEDLMYLKSDKIEKNHLTGKIKQKKR